MKRGNKISWFVLLSVFSLGLSGWAKPDDSISVQSPNGTVKISFLIKSTDVLKEGLFWNVRYNDKSIMNDSSLGFTLEHAPSMLDGFKVVEVKKTTNDSIWKPLHGEQSEVPDRYNQLSVTVEDRFHRRLLVEFRAYDEGAAERVTFLKGEKKENLTVLSEETQFSFPEDYTAWLTRNAQGEYSKESISKMRDGKEYERPLVMKTKEGTYLAVAEAGLLDFARMRLAKDPRKPNTIVSQLVPPVHIRTPYSTPWRLLMVAPNPCQLLQYSYMLPLLSPPSKIKDTSWIKPGKQMRDTTITKDGGFAIIDKAKKLGLDYIEIDAGWYGDESFDHADPTTVTPSRSRGTFTEADLKAVSAYAKKKGIKLIVYVNHRHLEKEKYIKKLLPLYKEWGISGLKFGFVNVGSQKWTEWLHRAVERCAKYQMIVDIHDEYRLTGIERTLPNILTVEGVRGNEARPLPETDLNNVFLRGLCGPADFTMCWHTDSLKMSWAHQMAASIAYFSPLQTLYWYDTADQFSGDEPYLAFFRALPTVWDQKVVIQGEIGEYITIARRKGDEWFVGSMNAIKKRDISFSLSFLDPNKKYKATIYSDDPALLEVTLVKGSRKGNPESKKLVIKTMPVTSETIIKTTMANNGGHAMHIVPIK